MKRKVGINLLLSSLLMLNLIFQFQPLYAEEIEKSNPSSPITEIENSESSSNLEDKPKEDTSATAEESVETNPEASLEETITESDNPKEPSVEKSTANDDLKDNVVVLISGESTTGFSALEEAVKNARDGDMIQLKQDITLNAPISIDKSLTLEGQGLSIESNLLKDDQSTLNIEKGKEVHIQNVVIQAASGTKGRAISVNEAVLQLDSVTVRGFSTGQEGGAVYANGASLNISSSIFENNTAKAGGAMALQNKSTIQVQNSSFTGNTCTISYWDYPKSNTNKAGGAILLAEGTQATIENNSFSSNSAPEANGGAICSFYAAQLTVRNNTFTGNTVRVSYITKSTGEGGFGGSIFSMARGTNLFENNTFTDGKADYGGAITFMNLFGMDSAIFKNNTIKNCFAGVRGGGMRLADTVRAAGEISIESGLIENCKADEAGGAIDFSGHDCKPLVLKNALITGNTARLGGGVWLCPTSKSEYYSTLGAAIYGNHAVDISASRTPYGDDIQYFGIDYPYNLGPGDRSASYATVRSRTLGGGKMDWYKDFDIDAYFDKDTESAKHPRYEPGDEVANSSLYTNTKNSFGLHGELREDLQELAASQARLILRNNSANTWGGAIIANSPLIFGEDADTSVHVHKVWEGVDTPPQQTTVALYRIDADGKEHVLDTGVVLNEENHWETTFIDLPSAYIDENGSRQAYTYTVKEEGLDDQNHITIDQTMYVSSTSGSMEDGFTITNKKVIPSIPLTPAYSKLKVIKKWEGIDEKEAPEVTIALVKNGEVTNQTLTLNADNQWTDTFTKLPSIDEDKVDSTDAQDKNVYNAVEVGEKDGKITLNQTEYQVTYSKEKNTVTITNQKIVPSSPLTPAYKTIKVQKKWQGIDVDKAPEITVNLIKNGEDTGQQLVLNKENDWTAVFDSLPVIDQEKITSEDPKDLNEYSVVEAGERDGKVTFGQDVYEVQYKIDRDTILILNRKVEDTSKDSKQEDVETPSTDDKKPQNKDDGNEYANDQKKKEAAKKSQGNEQGADTGEATQSLTWLWISNVSMIILIVLMWKIKKMKIR